MRDTSLTRQGATRRCGRGAAPFALARDQNLVIVAARMPMPRRVDAINIDDLPTSNCALYAALKIAASAFEFDLTEGDVESEGAKLLNPLPVVEVDIAKPDAPRLVPNSSAAGPDRVASHAAFVIVAMVTIAIPVAAIGLATMVDVGECRRTWRRRVQRLSERRCGKEQGRRNGKRSCSGRHDAVYHGSRKTHAVATQAERRVVPKFIKLGAAYA